MLSTVSVPCFTRVSILKKRAEIQNEYGVEIFFPRNGILPNNFQEMNIKGTNLSIQRAKRALDTIIIQAKEDYNAYKQRKANREEKMTRKTQPKFQASAEKTSTGKRSKNLYAALFEESESETETVEEFPTLGNGKIPTLPVWGPGMNPPVEESKTEKLAWGDISDDE